MSRFYVGQRVRIIGCHDGSKAAGLLGREAVVIGLDCVNSIGDPGYIGVSVNGDERWVFLSHQIEPITDSYDVTSWDTCVWRPEHLRIVA